MSDEGKPADDAKAAPGPLVLVEWEDAYNGDHDWFRASELPDEPEQMICRTAGFLVADFPERVTIAGSTGKTGDGDVNLVDLFTIPRGCIRAIRHLRPVE